MGSVSFFLLFFRIREDYKAQWNSPVRRERRKKDEKFRA